MPESAAQDYGIMKEFLENKSATEQRIWVRENSDKATALLWYFQDSMKKLIEDGLGI